jgi:hypothetical protein
LILKENIKNKQKETNMSVDILSALFAKFLREPVLIYSSRGMHVDAGQTAILCVTVIGYPNMHYQWKKNGVNISGADDCILVIKNVTAVDAGNYTCTITNKYGSITTPICEIDVHAKPVILVQPVAVEINSGAVLTVSVTASGSLPLSYQWYKNNVVIIGAISSTYTKTVSAVADTGFYSCKVSNQYGSVTSAAASVVVKASSVAPTINVQPQSASIFDGETLSLSIVASGTDPLTYQWKKNGSNIVGATAQAYTKTGALIADSGSYTCVVTNIAGSVESNAAVISVVGVAPVIDAQPQNTTVYDGSSFTLSVTAHGTVPLTYQWKKNGSNIAGATSSSYTKTGVMADSGSYTCVVTNVVSSTETNSAAVVVQGIIPVIDTQPTGTTILDGQSFTVTVVAHGTASLTYQWTKNGVNVDGATSATYTKNPAAMTDTGSYVCIVSNIAGSTSTNGVVVTVQGVAPVIDVQPQSVTISDGGNFTLSVTAHGTTPLTYQWKKDNVNIPGATTSTYAKVGALMSDTASYVCEVSNVIATTRTNVAVITVQAIAPTIQGQPQSATVDDGQVFTLTVVATGTLPLLYQWKKDTIDILGANSTTYTKSSVMDDSGSYTCLITNVGGSVTSSAAVVVVEGVEVDVVDIEPDSLSIIDGEEITLTVTATGTLPITYQWKKGGSNIVGATSSVYNKVGALIADSGSYTCVATNDFGTSTSEAVVVTVQGIVPVIDVQPQNVSIIDGGNFTLSVTAHGTIPLSYQWKKGGVSIVGATSATYSKAGAVVADSGSYTCVVTNVVDSTTSSAATVAVAGIAPAIVSMTGPQGNEVWQDVGTNFTITLVATGSITLTYQWRVDFTGTENDDGLGVHDITGAIDTVYSITNAQKTVSGFYSCKVTNAFSEAISYTMLVNIGETAMVISNPQSTTVDERQALQLTSRARGANLKFQWLRNGAPIGTIASVDINGYATYTKQAEVPDAGVYTCKYVSCLNDGNIPVDAKYAYSKTAVVAVTEIGFVPEITVQPVGVKVAQLGVTITGGQTGNASPGSGGPQYYYTNGTCVMDVSADGQYQVIMNNERFAYVSSDYGTTWVQRPNNLQGNAMSVSMSASGQYLNASCSGANGTNVSTDYGATWVKKSTVMTNPYSRSSSMDASGQYRMVQCWSDASAGAWLSKDYGNTWTKVVAQGGWGSTAISANGQYMYVGVAGVGLWKSSDYGTTWAKAVSDTGQTRSIATSYDGRYLMWGLTGSKIYSSANYGVNWTADGAPSGNYRRVAMSIDGKIRAGIPTENITGPIYLSRDFGVTYSALPNSAGKDWTDIAISADGTRVTGVIGNANIYVYTIYENQVSFTLSLTAIGTPPLSYQWKKEGIIIPGATTYYYYKDSVLVADLGNYTCAVTNNYGNVLSNVAVVEVG